MQTNFNIFYSWQSDLKENRNAIKSSIEKAINLVTKDTKNKLNLEINLDRDTNNNSGSPDIADTILQKILNSDIFICDVSVINNNLVSRLLNYRLIPNPNVLIELGYAIRHLGWERIICINNLKYGKTEQVPFDIRHHRITAFNSENVEFKETLRNTLKSAIKSIIIDYENINTRFDINKIAKHDAEIFETLNSIFTEKELLDNLAHAATNLCVDHYQYKKWKLMDEHYELTENQFLDRSVHQAFKDILLHLENFRFYCYNVFTKKSTKSETEEDFLRQEIKITPDIKDEILMSQRYFIHKQPFRNENWQEADKRVWKNQDELSEKFQKIKQLYSSFILLYKTKQLK